MLAALAVGFALAGLGGGLWLGGALALERIDLALAIPTLLAFGIIFIAFTEVLFARRAFAIGASALAALLLLALTVGASPLAVLSLIASAAVALGVSALLVGSARAWSRSARWAAFAGAAALWWMGSHVVLGWAYLPTPPVQAGRVVMLTGLPLVKWADSASSFAAREDASVVALRTMLAKPLVLVDGLAAGSLTDTDRLLLAHPYALPPAALVEVDRFVRAGGRAIILADGLSGWPPPHRFGDPRNPPITSLLTPLFDYWKIGLAAPVSGSTAAGVVRVDDAGFMLTLHSAGHFDRLPPGCRGAGALADRRPTVAYCQIGRGTAVLVADADLLFAPLWQSNPGWARHLRRSDNIEWLARMLNRPS